ncbi:putative nuclease HARBI1 [Prorops nasuta]|uniref:putative nuclease HARBI1 n=1 Tax=Prorops nasuta TaxID=863751 RepID=UPI0034CF39E3
MDHEVSEEHHQRRQRRQRIRILLQRCDYFVTLNNNAFRARFRLTKPQFLRVLRQIEPKLRNRQRSDSISLSVKLQAALRFYATGSFLMVIADFNGISKISAHRIVHEVSEVISELLPRYIKLPAINHEIINTSKNNFMISGMVRVIGAIDCVHVRIRSYGGDDAEIFRNRKGFFSINVQCVVNSNLEILDIVAQWPGSTHDSTIFESSCLKSRFDNYEFGNGVLLGDRGYRNHRYLMTPLAEPRTAAEQLYNESHIRTRCMVERCFGVWGRMFPVLTIGSRFKTPQRTVNVILATAVLYNITRRDKKVEKAGLRTYMRVDENVLFASPTEDERQYLIDNYFAK